MQRRLALSIVLLSNLPTICLAGLILMLCPASTHGADPRPEDVRVMSYNIRFGTASDGENHWEQRKKALVATIKAFDPDLLGTQETLAFQRDYLAQELPQYAVLGVGRDDGRQRGEMMALYYNHKRFEKLDGGHFWLSKTPDTVGSKSWDSSLPRMATWVKLRDRRNPNAPPIVFLNTHFDHLGAQARLESARLLRRRAASLVEQGASVILTGDFNTGEGSEPYGALFGPVEKQLSPLVDTLRVAHPTRTGPEGTFCSFKADATRGPRIDWIGVSRNWQVITAGIDRTANKGRTPSDHFAVFAVLRAGAASTPPTSGADAASDPASDRQLYAKAQEAWQASWERFYDQRTHLFYDFVCSYDPQKRLAGLPTPEEIRRQFPNRNGWGTGMEDCAISGGVMLSMICDRFAATGDAELRPAAEKAFAGLVLLGTLSPSEGFVIRGVSPTDGQSHYCESSRDQYTWYAYGLWRYYHSPLSRPAEQAAIRRILTAICARLERNVVAANDYHIGREDGTFDGLVDKMWENLAHETARLPMIYAIGADLTGERRWRDLARRFSPEAAAKSKGDSTKIPYALLQQQVSLEALYQLEQSPELKQQWLEAMQLTAGRARVFLARCREYRAPKAEQLDLDWRTWPLQRSSQGYQVPIRPTAGDQDNRTTREPAEAALVQLLRPNPSLTPDQLAMLRRTIAQVDYTKSVWYGLYYTQAVYWRAVRLGLVKLPTPEK